MPHVEEPRVRMATSYGYEGQKIEHLDRHFLNRAKAIERLREELMEYALQHAVRLDEQDYEIDVDPHREESVIAFLNHARSVDRFMSWVRLEQTTGEEAVKLLRMNMIGHRYEWPIEEDEEIALLVIAANCGGSFFRYEIIDLV